MSEIYPGVLLKCIQVDHYDGYSTEVGKYYLCEDVLPSDYLRKMGHKCTVHGDCNHPGIQLADKTLPPRWWWCAGCFVPINRGQIDWVRFAEAPLMKPTPADGIKVPSREPSGTPEKVNSHEAD